MEKGCVGTGLALQAPCALLSDLDKIVTWCDGVGAMTKATAQAIEREDQELVSELHKFFKEKSATFSPLRLADLAGVAFEVTFAGAKRD